MLLVVHELYGSLKQKITPTRNTQVVAVRPHLIKYNNPTGSLKIQLLDGDLSQVLDESEVVAISALPSGHFHGYVRFNAEFSLREGESYWIQLVSVGYTFSESAYIGWCNDYDLRKYEASYSPSAGYNGAMDFEIWEKELSSWSEQ